MINNDLEDAKDQILEFCNKNGIILDALATVGQAVMINVSGIANGNKIKHFIDSLPNVTYTPLNGPIFYVVQA